MKVKAYSNIGKRDNNEDYLAAGDHLFVLCDGVGGHSHGEFASQFIVNSLLRKMKGIEKANITLDFVNEIILDVQEELNACLKENPEYIGMGTTVCSTFISNNAIYLAHIGDSRIYFADPIKRRFWHSTDHSFVAELINSGIINENEAKDHYLSNQITRAIQANHKSEISGADLMKIENVGARSMILMCTDGVLESFNNGEIANLLCNWDMTIGEKIEQIERKCLLFSKDNHSALLIEFELQDQIVASNKDELTWTYLSSDESIQNVNESGYINEKDIQDGLGKSDRYLNKVIRIALLTFLILLIAFLTFSLLR